MKEFSAELYTQALDEIRKRIFLAESLSDQKDLVFIESTTLQVRKVLELIAYLSVLVNVDKLNHDEKNAWHPRKIIDSLRGKTTIFYPLPSHMTATDNLDGEPVMIPIGYSGSLTKEEFIAAYQLCGKILHAQHPLKPTIDIEKYFLINRNALNKIKQLIGSHTIGIKHEDNIYTFLHARFDFTNDKNTKPTYVQEFRSKIFREEELIQVFNGVW